jgi:hypothetical protein
VTGGSSILGRPGQTRAMFQASTTRPPVHTLTTVEGLLPSFHHGLHGSVGMIFYEEAVVVFGYIEGTFLVRRTGCVRERHAPCIEGSFLVSRTGYVCEHHPP